MWGFNHLPLLLLVTIHHVKTDGACDHAVAQQATRPDYRPLSGRPGYFWSLGNHRYNVTLSRQLGSAASAAPISVIAHWRRADRAPLDKAVYITAGAKSTRPIPCSFVDVPTSDRAALTFAPVTGVSDYFIYYQAFSTCEYPGGACSQGTGAYAAHSVYDSAAANQSCTRSASTTRIRPGLVEVAAEELRNKSFPASYQARAPFESYEPMELAMNQDEQAAFLQRARLSAGFGGIVVVPERHCRPIKMKEQIPACWSNKDVSTFESKVRPGENFTFQLAVVNLGSASRTERITEVKFSDLVRRAGGSISASAFRCMNMRGIDTLGHPYRNAGIVVKNGTVLPLWIAAVVPANVTQGTFSGTVRIAMGGKTSSVSIQLRVAGSVLPRGGDDDISRGTRLHWMDSTLGIDDSSVPMPYTGLSVIRGEMHDCVTVQMLGKEINIAPSGLPCGMATTLDRAGGGKLAIPRAALARPVTFDVDEFELAKPLLHLRRKSNMSVVWRSVAKDVRDAGSVTVQGTLDSTGYGVLNVSVASFKNLSGAGVRLTIQPRISIAKFAMGLGRLGGLLPKWLRADLFNYNSWLIFDFGEPINLDGLRLFSAGDGIHDPKESFLQVGRANSSSTGQYEWAETVGAFTSRANTTTPQDFAFDAASSRFWRWVITSVWPTGQSACSPAPFCQAFVREIQYHVVGHAEGVMLNNTGTASSSIVVSSSGGVGGAGTAPWKAVDGKLTTYWDTVFTGLPNPPDTRMINKTVWQWDGNCGNNGLWVGSTKVGVRLELKGDDPLWWAGSPHDGGRSPVPPDSWSNGGRGGIEAHINGTAVAYSGLRSMSPGDHISYIFTLMMTPVRPHNGTACFKERWAQLGGPTNYSKLAQVGVTTVNMHQGNYINPWINYPYLSTSPMKAAADRCRDEGMSFSIYNTVRVLSNRCIEYYAMLSFGEILEDGLRGGSDWLQEHMHGAYSPGWSNVLVNSSIESPDPYQGQRLLDVSLKVRGLSRWTNYYVAGLRQLLREIGAHGVYLDEIGYDRFTLQRVRNVLGDSKIDHHADFGFVSISPAMNYMEHYAFIDRLYYGEAFDYATTDADYWLVEVAAYPTGLTHDLLRYTSMSFDFGMTRFFYRGMLTGSTYRWGLGEGGPFDPTALWALWDAWQIENSTMIGWFEDIETGPGAVPVRLSNDAIKATVYVKFGVATMIVLADFSERHGAAGNFSSPVSMTVDWGRLGLDPASSMLTAPRVPPFQLDPYVGAFHPTHYFELSATQGGLLLILAPGIPDADI